LIPLPFVTLAALGVSVRPVPYSGSLTGRNPYHHLGGHLSNPPTFPSQSRLPEANSHLERGRWPCVEPRPWRNDDKNLLPMSENPTASGPPPSGPRQEERQSQRQPASATESQAAETAAASASWETSSRRHPTWHQPPLVGPRPELTQPRSIGVHAILNPPEASASRVPSRQSSREVLEMPSPQQHSSSSPLMRISNPSTQYLQPEHPSLSPGNRPRRIITPVSPAARFASKSSAVPPKVSVSQSPFVQDVSSGVYNVPPGVSLGLEAGHSPNLAVPGGRILPPQPSRHSTPTFHSRRASAGFGTNPSSQDTSPSTPHSTYSQFAPSPPTIGSTLLQPLGPITSLEPQPLFSPTDPISRTPSQMGGPRYSGPEGLPIPGTPSDTPPQPGMIPVLVDFKSGSRSQAEKRKANSDASRRFRNRKKNEVAMEQKINAQSEEIRLLREDRERLTEERDYYRTERDFFRESLSCTMGSGPLPSRPPSPRHFRPALGQAGSEAARGSVLRAAEGPSRSAAGSPAMGSAGTPGPASHPHMLPNPSPAVSGTSAGPSAYLTPTASGGQRIGREEGQLQTRPPHPTSWPAATASGDISGGQMPPSQRTYRAPGDPQPPRDPYGRSWHPGP
jgi:hypothetical protein